MARKQYEHQIDLVIAPAIDAPDAGYVALGAMADGVFMRLPAGLTKRLLSVLDIGSAVEAYLGNPALDGMVLKSTAAGVRSWGALPAGGVVSFNTRTGAVTLTKADVEAVLTGLINTHAHNYDNYSSWSLNVNGAYVKAVYSGNAVNFQAGAGIIVSYVSGNVNIQMDARAIDLLIGGLQVYKAGVNDPSVYSASGLRINTFSGAVMNEVFYEITMPENFVSGSNITAIVRWMPMTSPMTPQSVLWQLEYEWVNTGAALTGSPTLIQAAHVTGTAGFTHFKAGLGVINGVGKTAGSTILCRLFRDPANANDTYTGGAGLLAAGFRLPINTLGSAI